MKKSKNYTQAEVDKLLNEATLSYYDDWFVKHVAPTPKGIFWAGFFAPFAAAVIGFIFLNIASWSVHIALWWWPYGEQHKEISEYVQPREVCAEPVIIWALTKDASTTVTFPKGAGVAVNDAGRVLSWECIRP